MKGASVFLISLVTSVAATVLTVVIMFRFDLVPAGADGARVPDLHGLNRVDAQTNLEAKGLTLLIGGRKVDRNAQAGTVLSQSPLAGAKVEPGTTVTVTLAGEAPSVPDLTGRTVAEATLLLEQAGFKLQFGKSQPHDTIAKGRVVSQVPPAGTSFEPGRTVTLTTSSGPPTKAVPKVVGMGLARAKRVLQDAGFEVGDQRWTYDEDWGPYVVLRQEPGADDQARPGTAVDLVVNED